MKKNRENILRALVKEVLVERKINEMVRIASGVKLADNWEEKWKGVSENARLSKPLNRVINYLKQNGTGTLKTIANDAFNSPNAMQPAAGPVSILKQLGILVDTGLVEPKKEKTTVTGAFGRPKVTNDELKTIGLGVISKFSKGSTEFSDEEKEFITNLYNSLSSSEEPEA